MKNYIQIKILLLAFIFPYFTELTAQTAIATPYPETILLHQINSAEKERSRHAQNMLKFDRQPTGFYIEASKEIVVNVQTITPTADGAKPVLTVGTLGFNVGNRNTGTHHQLSEGVNTITSQNAGLIYLTFVTSGLAQPVGQVSITFTGASKHVRAPRYVYGVTTDAEFAQMMDMYQTPDVIFHSDFAIVCATREAANLYSLKENKDNWMNQLHKLIELEDEISGMDNNDPNPLHHRLKTGEVRYLLVENTSPSPHASQIGYTGYPNGSRHRYLTMFNTVNNNSWMLGHELGHQHQQPAYLINKSGESTVNIYSYVVERDQVERVRMAGVYSRTSATRWQQVQSTYLNLPIEERIYNMDDAELRRITGYNHDETRFMPWEQLFLAFGDEFYKILHRIVREEKITSGSNDERRAYLIWKASQITGYDLTEFFNLWGIRIMEDNAVRELLKARIYTALMRGNIEPLPITANEMVMTVTGQQRPEWIPLPLKGIKSSKPPEEVFDRTKWTITTSINGFPDANTNVGGDDPYHIINGTSDTRVFSFVKPGRTVTGGLNGTLMTAPVDYIPSFTIDMKEKAKFNYFVYRHRADNAHTNLRASRISFFGGSSENDFEPIRVNIDIPFSSNQTDFKVSFDEVEYRYVKLEITDWDKVNGYTIQVSDFRLGVETPEDLLQTVIP